MTNMRGLFIAVIGMLMIGSGAAAASPPPMNQVMKPVNMVLVAMAHHDAGSISGAYTSDAVIVDDQAPYQWSGSDGPRTWLSSVTTWGKLRGARFTVLADPDTVMMGPDSAYAIVIGTLHGLGAHAVLKQNAAITFALRNEHGHWKIASQSWTNISPAFKLNVH